MSWNVPYINLGLQYIEDKQRIDEEFNRVMSNGSFILRDDVNIFEKKMAGILNVKHVIGVNSGTDALYLAVRALKIGVNDEVITVAHTFVATIAAIHHAGGSPALIDINSDYNMDTSLIENAITEKTKAIIPVHMNGRMCNMDIIMKVAEKYNLVVIEDAAQALGAKYKGSYSGSIGDIGCFSLHPMKILSCPGDGGFITTNSDILNNKLRLLRNHGQKTKTELNEYGYSSRLDNLHAAIVNVKLDRLADKIDRRRFIARIYNDKLSKLPIRLPNAPEDVNTYYDVYNSYVINVDDRDRLYEFMIKNGVEVFIHMGKPLYENNNLCISQEGLTRMTKCTKKILSLPIYPEMKDSDVLYVISTINKFYTK